MGGTTSYVGGIDKLPLTLAVLKFNYWIREFIFNAKQMTIIFHLEGITTLSLWGALHRFHDPYVTVEG